MFFYSEFCDEGYDEPSVSKLSTNYSRHPDQECLSNCPPIEYALQFNYSQGKF